MKISDEVYGEEVITEPVLLDLINSKAVQRLKGVAQFGVPDDYYFKKGFSRYEHSIGVLVLLRRMGASLKEQIAGLLHDVSHTAFSHVVDWVIGDPNKEDYQDNILMEVIESSDIPEILESYGVDYKEFATMESFSLLEQDAPSLCADRVDYALREIKALVAPELLSEMVNALKCKNNRIVFSNKESAKIFAENYSLCQKEHWGSDQAKTRFHIFADVLKKAMEMNLITVKDFGKVDSEIMGVLENSIDGRIVKGLSLLKNGFVLFDGGGEGSIRLQNKFRYIDPEVLVDGKIRRYSEVSNNYKDELEKQKANAKLECYVRIVAK
jgi:uncharacterized protein